MNETIGVPPDITERYKKWRTCQSLATYLEYTIKEDRLITIICKRHKRKEKV